MPTQKDRSKKAAQSTEEVAEVEDTATDVSGNPLDEVMSQAERAYAAYMDADHQAGGRRLFV